MQKKTFVAICFGFSEKIASLTGLHKAACHILSKAFFEIDEDMVQILLVLEVLFTQDSEVEDLFCGASSRSEPIKIL